jgi:isoleucyl-tRNA synthetase
LSYSGQQLGEYFEAIIADEVNVKEVKYANEVKTAVSVDKNITPELQREGMMREVIRGVQNARKQAGLNVDDHIMLHFVTEVQMLKDAIVEHKETIQNETLGVLKEPGEGAFYTETTIEGADLAIALQKV